MIESIDRTRLCDVVANRLQTYIVENGLKTGDRLPTEAQLAVGFGVSRLSLREATRLLGFLGIVDAKPGRGLTVGRMNINRVTECLSFHPALQDADPSVLIDTRVAIELGVIPHVARRMSSDSTIYDRLNNINRELRQAGTLERWVKLDIEFHRGLMEASGLTPLLAFSDVLSVFFQSFRESVKKAEWSKGIECHQTIIDELQAGHVAEAEALLRAHIEYHKRRIGNQD